MLRLTTIFIFLCIPSLLSAMKITPKIETEEPTAKIFLEKALIILRKKNQQYEVFNPSTDIRNLSFMAPCLKRDLPQAMKLKKYEKELTTLYLITMKLRSSVGTAQIPSKSFLIDIKRIYIMPLKEYPENVEQKCSMLSHYFTKSSISKTVFKQKTPQLFREQIKGIISSVATSYPHLRISTIVTLDRSHETGFFALLRFIDQKNHMVQQTVYELQSMKQFCWDIQCGSIKEYYIKHRLFFIQQLTIIT